MFEFLKKIFGGGPKVLADDSFGYAPVIKSGDTVREFKIGQLNAQLITNIQSAGHVEYEHILAVYSSDGKSVYFTASEKNSMAEQFGGGTHFLGVFDGSGHANMGDDNKWADIETFAEESIRLVKEQFNIS